MPELPEIETVLRGTKPHIAEQRVIKVVVRHYGMRWPVPTDLNEKITGKKILNITRRAKYLLFHFRHGTLIIHLGMSGSLRLLTEEQSPKKHDHIDFLFSNQMILRFNDPRRFGAILWTDEDVNQHPLLAALGVEPLDKHFDKHYLWKISRKRKTPIKSFIMNNHIVVGVGNIYAAEALFLAKIHPKKTAADLTLAQCEALTKAIKTILQKAIKQGGTTLKDFVNSKGKPGYFSNYLQVYGRAGQPCMGCKTELKTARIGQRSTVWCPECQI